MCLNCTKRDTLCQQRVQPRIKKLALANYQIPLSKCRAIPSKKHTMRPPFWESFLNPKWGIAIHLIYLCNHNGADSHFGSCFPAPFFFPSGLAVNALWHGPDRYISGEKGDTQHNWLVSKSKAYLCTNKTNNQPRQDDPQIPQPDLRFASSKAKQQENGAGPKQKHPHLMPFSTVAFSHCKKCKNMQSEKRIKGYKINYG